MLFLLLFLSCGSLLSQQYYFYDINSENEKFRIDLINYCKDLNRLLKPDASLDSVVMIRSKYFLDLSLHMPKIPLDRFFDSIPKGKKAHERQFGNPTFFKEGYNDVYTPPLVIIPVSNIEITAEIMEEFYVSIDTIADLTIDNLIKNAIQKFIRNYGQHYMIDSYIESPQHNAAILKCAKFCYGTHTRAVIRKQCVKSGFLYEIIFINCTSFGKNIGK